MTWRLEGHLPALLFFLDSPWSLSWTVLDAVALYLACYIRNLGRFVFSFPFFFLLLLFLFVYLFSQLASSFVLFCVFKFLPVSTEVRKDKSFFLVTASLSHSQDRGAC